MKLKFKPNLGAAKDRKGVSRGGGGGRQQGLVAGSSGGQKRGPSMSCEESMGEEESGMDHEKEIEPREQVESSSRVPEPGSTSEVSTEHNSEDKPQHPESKTSSQPTEQQLHTSEGEQDQSTQPEELSPRKPGHGTTHAQLTRKPVSLTGEQKGPAGRMRRKKVAPNLSARKRGTAVTTEEPSGKSTSDDLLTETPSSSTVDVQSDASGPNVVTEETNASLRSEMSGDSSCGQRLRRAHQSLSQSSDQNTDEIISNTLSEVLDNAHTSGQFAPGDTNLSGIVRSSLDLICPPPESEEELILDSRHEGHDRNSEDFGHPTGLNLEQSSEELRHGLDLEPGSSDGCRRRLRTNSQSSEIADGSTGGQSLSSRTTKGKSGRSSGTKRRQSTGDDVTVQTKRPRSSSLRSTRIREAPDRSTMTMQELIYYNPSANPMASSVEERKRKQKDREEGDDTPQQSRELDSTRSSLSPDGQSQPDPSPSDERLVPQLRIANDGTIIIDEESMVMETTQKMATDAGEPVVECTSHTTSNSFRKSPRVTKWTKKETSQFFTALSKVGTDFTMMTLLMPKRSRKELKNKFKKEEKSNPDLITQALKNQVSL